MLPFSYLSSPDNKSLHGSWLLGIEWPLNWPLAFFGVGQEQSINLPQVRLGISKIPDRNRTWKVTNQSQGIRRFRAS